jgi:6-pyruvoyltetrahydropterin/6-carboxytetrahydropterin synthase
MHTVTVSHNFEAAHRLPHLPGKCQSLHGHSWWVDVTYATDDLVNGIAVEFGQAKQFLRGWVDEHLDHGTILGHDDPLAKRGDELGKVHVLPFGCWPTVEYMAEYLAGICARWCVQLNKERSVHRPQVFVYRVRVQETHVNAASWEADPYGSVRSW